MGLLVQLLVNGIVLSVMYAVLGVSWGVIFNVTGTFHFAQALAYLLAGYVGAYVFGVVGLPFVLSFLISIAAALAFGIAVELWFYCPLRRLSASPLVILIASLGLLILGENIILLVFGTIPLSLTGFEVSLYSVGPVTFTSMNIITVVVCIIVLVAYVLFLNRTTTGKAMRAVASDPQMSEVVGINIPKIYLLAFIIGSGLAGITGFLHAAEIQASLGMGMQMVLIAFMATLMGGVGHLWGAAIVGVIMGMVQSFGLLVIGSQWQTAILYLLLTVVIVIWPRGIFGSKAIGGET